MKDIEIVRVYIREGERSGGLSLMEQIFKTLHDRHKVRGVTVFRGIAGFGSHGEIHADDLLRMTVHLPLVVEFFDTTDVVERTLTDLQGLVPPNHIVRWRAQCL